MGNEILEFFAEEDVESVVVDPFKFKAKLGIGSESFTYLSKAEHLRDVLAAAGGATLGASVVGGAWVASLGTMGSLGLALGVVSTPIGWIAAAGTGSAALFYGFNRLLRGQRKSAVDEVPKFINTPLDLLASNLVEVLLPPLIHMAKADGEIKPKELDVIIKRLADNWGISATFVTGRCDHLIKSNGKLDLHAWSEAIVSHGGSADVSLDALTNDLLSALEEVMHADSIVTDSEMLVLEELRTALLSDARLEESTPANLPSEESSETAGSTLDYTSKWISRFFEAGERPLSESAELARIERLPTLWTLGKTGSGKSSFIKSLSGYLHIPVGNGFKPCTQGLDEYTYPEENPLIKLLDTRGLGEADYDPATDIEHASSLCDVIVVVAKIDEPNQADVIEVLRKARSFGVSNNLIVLHTGAELGDQTRQFEYQKEQFDKAWRDHVYHVRVDLYDKHHPGNEDAEAALIEVLPSIALMIKRDTLDEVAASQLAALHPMIINYSGLSATMGAVPIIGSVTVLTAQSKMVRQIAEHHEIEWSPATLYSFIGALGTSFAATQLASIGARSALSVIPGVGSIAAGAMAFGTTYAFGRLAHYYFFKSANGLETSEEELQALFVEMFKRGEAYSGGNI